MLRSIVLLGVTAAAAQEDPFQADVRATPWLAPADEQKALHVPDGFEIRCFAHEPDLWKPMNVAFDARGRLWCTSSNEYPVPIKNDRGFLGKDKVTIHEDTDGDGVADKVTVFADELNIPIGLYPCVDEKGHDGCVVFSIPNIWRLHDDDGDGVCDRREVLYGPMGWERDTHGLNNSFRRGFDGWIYANHGYNNVTTVKGTDGHEVHMESGNSYRFKLDGSRIEQFTQGQVNPFGSCFDARGDLYTADCHSLPITLLLRGGCYPSFGAPDDGLGFTPQVMKHLHGSTALCGLAIASGANFPASFRGDVFVGNVMSCRVHRDRLEFDGSTPRAVEQPDLVTSDDPWFRPVDLQFGPDGALYVADFYNRIIGHYEVPLNHPGRDRTSGRIWRITYAGKAGEAVAATVVNAPDLRAAGADLLVKFLGDANVTTRLRALDELTDRVAKDDAVRAVTAAQAQPQSEAIEAMLLWAQMRLGLPPIYGEGEEPSAATFESRPPLVRLHVLRVLAETGDVKVVGEYAKGRTVIDALVDADPFVRRAAVDVFAQRLHWTPLPSTVQHLFDTLGRTPPNDAILRHATRIALRNQLRDPAVFAETAATQLGPRSNRELATICLALQGEAVGAWLIDHAAGVCGPDDDLAIYLEHAAREASPSDLPRLAEQVRQRWRLDAKSQLRMLEAILTGLDRRGSAPADALASWGADLMAAMLKASDAAAPAWRDVPVAGHGRSANPWCVQTRECADGVTAPMLCSLPKGETLTGALRSPPFALPPKLAFFVAGHNDELARPAIPFNKVRVRDAASGELLAEVLAPRDDVARRFEVDLAGHAGAQGFLELVDGNHYDAYAWLAVGRFEPPVVALPARSPADVAEETLAGLRLAGRFKSEAVVPQLRALLAAGAADPGVRAGAAAALLALAPSPDGSALATLIDDPDTPVELVEPVCAAIAAGDMSALSALALRAVELCPSRQQLPLALALARTRGGSLGLLDLVRQGKAPPALLKKSEIREAIAATLVDEKPNGSTRVLELTRGLPSEDEQRARLIADRRRDFARHGGDARRGADVFKQSCAVCHAFGGAGPASGPTPAPIIGPQLDGIKLRGFERLLEDVLDANRNVDVRFQRTHLFLKNGEVVSGLVRPSLGETVVYVDEQGKEHEVPNADVEKQRASRLSLMPDNFGELLSEEQTRDLVAFLLAGK